MKVYENHCSISTLLKLKVLGIDIGIGIFNTFQMEKSIEVLGIQYNWRERNQNKQTRLFSLESFFVFLVSDDLEWRLKVVADYGE